MRELIEAWHWSYVDFDMIFEGLAEKHLHARPGPGALSISEGCAHLMRSEASIILRYLFGEPPELWEDHFMLKAPYGWPPDILMAPVDLRLREMTAKEIRLMVLDRHERLYQRSSSLDLPLDHRFEDDWSGPAPTVEVRLRFAAYHVAYHAGQMYEARHLLGETTPDN